MTIPVSDEAVDAYDAACGAFFSSALNKGSDDTMEQIVGAMKAGLAAAAPHLVPQIPNGWKLVPFGWWRRYVKGDRLGIEVSVGAERPPEWENADPLYSLAKHGEQE